MRSSSLLVASALAATRTVRADVQSGEPVPAPAGYEQWISPIVVPSPPTTGTGNWAASVARAKAFVAGLTLEEKVNITTGIGQAGRCVGNTGSIPRLGFDGFCLQDGPLGVRFADFASAFPAEITAASTWDVELIYARAQAMGSEFKGKGMNVALGPMTNLARVAAGGRNWEGFGGDPYLSGIMSAETVKGLQDKNVIACVKHFIAQEQEHSRSSSSSNVDDRTLHELYAWPFADAVHAGVGSVMCSYNRINQTYACENSKLLNGIMKEELGFQGFLLSDWAAMKSGVSSALAGTDMNMPGFKSYGTPVNVSDPSHETNSWWGANLVDAVNNGSVPIERLDDMVTRTFAAYYQVGQDKNFPTLNFDGGVTGDYRDGVLTNEHVNVQDNHKDIIRKVAAAGTVLVKNVNGALPLKLSKSTRLGVFGSDAGPHPVGPNLCSTGARDKACDEGTLAMGWGSGTANFPYLVDPLAAISTHVLNSKTGATIEGVLDDYAYTAISTIAQYADACIVFANADSGESYLTVDTNAGDRNNLTLWHSGDALIQKTASVCSNTIVVLHTVGAVIVEPWIENPNVTAVLFAHLPGQESGNAIVDVLFGAVNPSGKLPYTVAKKPEDYPTSIILGSGTVQITYKEELNIDYRHFDTNDIAPRFEFGFGLSYTTFAYSNLKLSEVVIPDTPTNSSESLPPGGHPSLWQTSLTATYTVKNTGKLDGHEVSQLYLSYPEGSGEPPKVLRGFARTSLRRGQSSTIKAQLRKRDLAVWDVVLQQWVVPAGEFTMSVGASSRDIHLTAKFTV